MAGAVVGAAVVGVAVGDGVAGRVAGGDSLRTGRPCATGSDRDIAAPATMPASIAMARAGRPTRSRRSRCQAFTT